VYASRPLLVSALLLIVAAPVFAQTPPRPPALSAEAVLLVDPEGRTIFAKNAESERAPASLVKLMTLYIACELIEAKKADVDDLAEVSVHAANTPKYRMGLRARDRVAVIVLLEGVAIASANDAATALAEHLAGDEATFVGWMNDKAQELGLTSTRFANPHGLPDPAQHSTARDMALLIARLLTDHPMSRPLLGGQTFIYNGRVYARHIPLFNDPGGVQALKTGFTNEAGYNLAVSAWRNERQFLMVVMGARTRAQSFLDAKRLLRYGFLETGLETPPDPKPRLAPRRSTPRRSATTSATPAAGIR
jgi:D-alanyl-D-alanine carboxypeptidase